MFVVTERSRGLKQFEIIDGIPVYRTFCLWPLRKIFRPFRDIYTKIILPFNKQTVSPKDDASIMHKTFLWRISHYLFIYPISYLLPVYSFMISSFFQLWRLRKDYDIIHVHEAHWIAILGVFAGKFLGKKVIIKESCADSFPTLDLNLRLPFGRRIIKTILKADCFVAISESVFRDITKRGVSSEKIVRIPNGVSVFGNIRSRRPGSNAVVLFNGSLYRSFQKGLDILLKSWGEVIRKCSYATLNIIGEGDATEYIEYAKKIGIYSSINFLGRIEEVGPYLEQSKVFLLTSRWEGMSNALLEAMACGLACVATDVSGARELIQNGVNGLLVPKDNAQALADAIVYMLYHPEKAEQMGSQARKTIIEEYDIRIVVNKYIEMYDKVKNL